MSSTNEPVSIDKKINNRHAMRLIEELIDAHRVDAYDQGVATAESTVTALRARIVELEAHNRVMCERVDRLEADAARFTLDELAEACMFAEISDSKYESLCLAMKTGSAPRSARKE